MGEGFDKKIYDSYNNVSNDSVVRLSKLRGKIQLFSIGIIESLQRIVDKQPLILKTEDEIPFLENACCHEDNILNTYEYFVTLDETIQKYNEQVIKYKSILQKHLNLCIAPSLISLLNNRKEKTPRSYIYSESTIYLSFIKYCNFNTGIQLNQELSQICNKNISEIKKIDTIEDKIDILKSEGHNWNDEALKQLLLYISKKDVENQNLIEPDSSILFDEAKKIVSVRSVFENWVEASKNTQIHPEKLNEFLPLMGQLYDTYDITQTDRERIDGSEIDFIEEVIAKINYENNKMKKIIIKRLSENVTKSQPTVRFIEQLNDFEERGEDIFMSKVDETQYYLSQTIKNMIKDMLITFPSLIKNESDRFTKSKIKLPKHWGFGSNKFSQSHKNNIKNSITPLNKLEKYACDEECKLVIEKVIKKRNDIIQFINIFPFITNIDGSKTIFNGRINSSVILCLFYMTIELYYDIIEELVSNKYDKTDTSLESDWLGMEEEYRIMVSNIMNTYFNIFKNTKEMINKDSETIKNNVLKEKESEKENIKNEFNLLDDEHRKIEREMKNLKLGEWSVGLSKAVYQYDPAMYDKEIQNQERLNQMLRHNEIVLSAAEQNNEGNIFSPLSGEATTILQQQESEQEIHDERYGMMAEQGDDDDWQGDDDLY
jgi:hypothetical protein